VDLDENAAFARARAFYEASDYSNCEQAFSALLRVGARNRPSTREALEQARIYHAACLVAEGKPRDADEQLQVAIRDNPLIEAPDPLIFPPPFVDRFFAVRSRLLAEIRRAEEERVGQLRRQAEAGKQQDAAMQARIAELEQVTRHESVVQENSRWFAAVPFGVGQFQNREPALGWLFLTSEVLLTGAATTAVSIQLGLHAQANGGTSNKDTAEINRRLRFAHKVELISLGSLLGVTALGILQAELAFEPEFRLPDRVRKVEKASVKPTLTPTVTPTTGGAVFGLNGTF